MGGAKLLGRRGTLGGARYLLVPPGLGALQAEPAAGARPTGGRGRGASGHRRAAARAGADTEAPGQSLMLQSLLFSLQHSKGRKGYAKTGQPRTAGLASGVRGNTPGLSYL